MVNNKNNINNNNHWKSLNNNNNNVSHSTTAKTVSQMTTSLTISKELSVLLCTTMKVGGVVWSCMEVYAGVCRCMQVTMTTPPWRQQQQKQQQQQAREMTRRWRWWLERRSCSWWTRVMGGWRWGSRALARKDMCLRLMCNSPDAGEGRQEGCSLGWWWDVDF